MDPLENSVVRPRPALRAEARSELVNSDGVGDVEEFCDGWSAMCDEVHPDVSRLTADIIFPPPSEAVAVLVLLVGAESRGDGSSSCSSAGSSESSS